MTKIAAALFAALRAARRMWWRHRDRVVVTHAERQGS